MFNKKINKVVDEVDEIIPSVTENTSEPEPTPDPKPTPDPEPENNTSSSDKNKNQVCKKVHRRKRALGY